MVHWDLWENFLRKWLSSAISPRGHEPRGWARTMVRGNVRSAAALTGVLKDSGRKWERWRLTDRYRPGQTPGSVAPLPGGPCCGDRPPYGGRAAFGGWGHTGDMVSKNKTHVARCKSYPANFAKKKNMDHVPCKRPRTVPMTIDQSGPPSAVLAGEERDLVGDDPRSESVV